VAHPLLVDLDSESVQAAIQRLFDTGVILEDLAFYNFVGTLCKLSLEMVSTHRRTDVGTGTSVGTAREGTLDAEYDTIPSATRLVTPRTELFSRRWRWVSGICILCALVHRRHRQTFSLN